VRFDHFVGDHQGPSHDLFAGHVIERRLERRPTLRRGVFGMRVIDVEARAIRENRVGEVRLDDGGEGSQVGQAARVHVGRLAFEVQLIRVRPSCA